MTERAPDTLRLYFNQPVPDDEERILVSGSIPLHGITGATERAAALEARVKELENQGEAVVYHHAATMRQMIALIAAARAVETDAATSGEALHVMRMRNGDLQDERDRFRARAAALEAAARAIVADCRVPRGDYLGDGCRWCDNTIDQEGHRPGCPAGILAALLDGDA
jgi:hypothetical protein